MAFLRRLGGSQLAARVWATEQFFSSLDREPAQPFTERRFARGDPSLFKPIELLAGRPETGVHVQRLKLGAWPSAWHGSFLTTADRGGNYP